MAFFNVCSGALVAFFTGCSEIATNLWEAFVAVATTLWEAFVAVATTLWEAFVALFTVKRCLEIGLTLLKTAVAVLTVTAPEEDYTLSRSISLSGCWIALCLVQLCSHGYERWEDRSLTLLRNPLNWYHRSFLGLLFFYDHPNPLGQPVFYRKSIKHLASGLSLVGPTVMNIYLNRKSFAVLSNFRYSEVEMKKFEYKMFLVTTFCIAFSEMCDRIGREKIPHYLVTEDAHIDGDGNLVPRRETARRLTPAIYPPLGNNHFYVQHMNQDLNVSREGMYGIQ